MGKGLANVRCVATINMANTALTYSDGNSHVIRAYKHKRKRTNNIINSSLKFIPMILVSVNEIQVKTIQLSNQGRLVSPLILALAMITPYIHISHD